MILSQSFNLQTHFLQLQRRENEQNPNPASPVAVDLKRVPKMLAIIKFCSSVFIDFCLINNIAFIIWEKMLTDRYSQEILILSETGRKT